MADRDQDHVSKPPGKPPFTEASALTEDNAVNLTAVDHLRVDDTQTKVSTFVVHVLYLSSSNVVFFFLLGFLVLYPPSAYSTCRDEMIGMIVKTASGITQSQCVSKNAAKGIKTAQTNSGGVASLGFTEIQIILPPDNDFTIFGNSVKSLHC